MFPNPFFAAMGGPFGPGLNNMGGMPGAGMPGQGLPGFMGNQGMQGPGMQQGPAGPMVPMTANQDGQGGGGSGGGGGGGAGRQGGDKNRYCKMFMQTGSCSYGEACKYPHITREMLQNGGGAMQGGGGGGGGMGNQQADRRGDRRGGRGAGAGGGGGIGGGGGGGSGGPGGGMVEEEASGRGKNQGARKTRLCDKFMTQGYCPYGSACTFAHGMEELRQPGSREGGQQQQQQQPVSPPPTAVPGPAPPPEPYPGTAAAARGQTAPSGQQGAKPASGGNNDGTAAAGAPTAGAATAQTTGNSAKEVTFVDKVRALCGVLGIGNAAALAADKPLALQTAAMSLRNANAFKENPFADSVERYIATQQGQG